MPRHRRYFGRAAIRDVDKRLIPAIIACQVSICFIFFGIFGLFVGIVISFTTDDKPSSPAFDTPFFNEHRKSFNETPRKIGRGILFIGVTLISIAVLLLVFSGVMYLKYERDRRKQNRSYIPSQPTAETQQFGPSAVQTNPPPPNIDAVNQNNPGYAPYPGYPMQPYAPTTYTPAPPSYSDNPPMYPAYPS